MGKGKCNIECINEKFLKLKKVFADIIFLMPDALEFEGCDFVENFGQSIFSLT